MVRSVVDVALPFTKEAPSRPNLVECFIGMAPNKDADFFPLQYLRTRHMISCLLVWLDVNQGSFVFNKVQLCFVDDDKPTRRLLNDHA